MNWLSEKSYIPFLILIPIALFIGILKRKETLDVNVHDTYFVINNLHLAILFSFFVCTIALGYFLAKKFNVPLNNWMTSTHVTISLLGILIVYILFKVQINLQSNNNDIEFFLKYTKIFKAINYTMISILMISIFAQLLFLINIIIGFLRK